jgi:uncharacterized protein
MEKDQAFVDMVVKSIVDMPDKVVTERTVDERGVLITLTVDPSDMGKLIGKEGRTAKAIRTLLRVLGAKNNARVNLKISEPEGGTGGRPREIMVDDSADMANEQPMTNEPMEAPIASEQPNTDTFATGSGSTQSADEGQATELI